MAIILGLRKIIAKGIAAKVTIIISLKSLIYEIIAACWLTNPSNCANATELPATAPGETCRSTGASLLDGTVTNPFGVWVGGHAVAFNPADLLIVTGLVAVVARAVRR